MPMLGGIEPEMDPSFLAFQRALGVEESELRASIAMRRSAVQRRIANQLPQVREATQRNVRDIGLSAEARGVFRGGNRAQDQSDEFRKGFLQEQQIVQGGEEEIAGLESELATQLAANRRRQSEAELEARQRLGTSLASSNGVS